MNTQKFLISGIAGGVTSLLAGWVIYGKLLMDFFAKNGGTATGVMRTQADMVWWALILGNLSLGLLFSYIFNKAGNVNTFGAGAAMGAVISLFMTAGNNLIQYAVTNLSNINAMCVDILVGIVMGVIVGGVVGAVNGMGAKK